ncbi:DUF6584 family protein [Priestia endophytica]|uniref:DUF6584 family protein n=1 Tax=Priestia endophytica TaxID=135735 RepID=UPI000DCA3E37|nr:DUF6584 family protein [Priestia endophytica]RAS83558.1 DNA helicase [Priestia endophytica]
MTNEVFLIEKIPSKTLKKIQEDIEKNDLGKARDRLHGLMSTYPNELALRKKLGDIYFLLKYPDMAGRYWYLEENKTPEMVEACLQFKKSMGNDPIAIAKGLKFKGESEILEKLELRQETSPIQHKVKESLLEEPQEPFIDKVIIFGIFSILILTILFALIGVYTVFNWIF